MDGTVYRARLLDLAAFPRSVLLQTMASADAIVHALKIIFGGHPVRRPHQIAPAPPPPTSYNCHAIPA